MLLAPPIEAPPVEAPVEENRTVGFAATLSRFGMRPLTRAAVTTVQVNVGKLCNLACHHCHVEAGPKRTERMNAPIARRVVELLERTPDLSAVDLTGGAPELNENFRFLVSASRRLSLRVIDRCNLTVLRLPGQEDLASFLAANEVEIVASLPCYEAENVDRQRGRGVFNASIEALGGLNALGYGANDRLPLDLVYNPLGDALPPPQGPLEAKYREELRRRFGIEFRHLFAMTNLPVRRFADYLRREGRYEAYLSLLAAHFNPATIDGLMCRSLVSVGWDGRLYDCDFNQMLDLGAGGRAQARTPEEEAPLTIFEIDSFTEMAGLPIATGSHCFGCTAGCGSSCGGSIL